MTQFFSPIEANQNELRNAVLQNLGAAPSTPLEGQVYHDTGTHRPRVYCGATDGWQTLLTSATRLDQLAAPTAAVGLNGQKITGLADGTNATDAATYGQLLTAINGFDWKSSVRVATIAALPANTRAGNVLTASANGALTVDGVAVAVNDRILVKDEATAANNGIYVVTAAGGAGAPFVLTRAADADSSAKVTANMTVAVAEGSAPNADKWFQVTTNDAIVLNTTPLTFAVVGAGTVYSAGNGLQLTGAVFSVKLPASSGLVADGTGLYVDTTVVTRKNTQTIGDGVASVFTVTHNLGNADVHVQVWEAGATGELVFPKIQKNDANSVKITFSTVPTAGQYKVVTQG